MWAWRPGRAKKVAGLLDHLIALLPFEPPYFEVEGLKTTFVGHPVLESGADAGDGPGFRARHGFSGDDLIIAVLPGSRMGEVTRLGPVFAETLFLLKKKFPGLGAVVPTVSPVARTVRRLTAEWPVPALVLEGDPEKYDAFAAADIALAASGTVALELALTGTPAVNGYKTKPLTALHGNALFNASLANNVQPVPDREEVHEPRQAPSRPPCIVAAVGVGAVYTFWRRGTDPVRANYWLLLLAIFLMPTIHPWYLLWPLPLAAAALDLGWLTLTVLAPLSYWILVDAGTDSSTWVEPGWVRFAIWVPALAVWAWAIT